MVEVLPGGYGLGGAALAAWIAERMADDVAAHRRLWPPAWGEPPQAQARDLRPLGFGYGMDSGTVARWIAQNAEFYGGDQVLVHEANAKQEASRAENAAFQHGAHGLGRAREDLAALIDEILTRNILVILVMALHIQNVEIGPAVAIGI